MSSSKNRAIRIDYFPDPEKDIPEEAQPHIYSLEEMRDKAILRSASTRNNIKR